MKEIYLDNAATTRCLDSAAQAVAEMLTENYGNPSSMHNRGFEAEKRIRSARETVSNALKCSEKEIIFTSGGTEGNNLAISGAARANRRAGRHIVTTMIEHPSVYQPVRALEDEGYEITYIPVDKNGVISLDLLSSSLRDDTILCSVMHVNNETGTVEPLEKIRTILNKRSDHILFHVDAVQSFGKLPINPGRVGIDLLTVSGHKLHGPKGSGFLYLKNGTKLSPEILGGGQESGMRSGTENTAAIAGLGVAVEEAMDGLSDNSGKMRKLKHMLSDRISVIDGVSINGPQDGSEAPHILSVSVEGVKSEVLLHALEDRGIYVSAGSACSSNRPAKSRTLQAIGLENSLLDSTIRFSLSRFNTEDEMAEASEAMKELVPVLSRYRRK